MAQIVVIGGGLVGLTAGMLLARDGHQVTVTERDAAGPRGRAGDVWQRWDRRGVNQFRQLHFMLPRWRAVMERELPEVIAELEALGGVRTSMLGALPDEMTGGKRDGDERFETVTGRRPVLEAAVAQAAKCTDGLTVCRGVAVTGLVTGAESIAGVPHVAGVTIGGATQVHADLVVDAAGRRSPVSGMLAAIGARRPDEEKEDCGFVYYARHFRSPDGSCPPAMERLLQHFEGVSILTLPCDSGTWGVGLVTSARDKELRALRAVPAWEAALALFPNVAHWGAAEPITGVQVIAGIEDRHRRHVVDGEPVVTGLAAVGDAWACTNPSLGRGASIGLLHACALRDLLREVGPDEPERLARRFDEVTQATVGPYYRATLEFDRHRLAEINGEITGQPYQPDDPAWDFSKALYAAAACDPDVLRAYTSVAAMTALPMRRAGRAGHAGQGDLARLDGAQVLRPGPAQGRTPRRPRPLYLTPPAPASRTAHAGHGGGAGRQPFGPDGLPAPFAHPVPALRQPPQRVVDRRHLFPRRLEQRGGVLPLERERRALRVVLVVGPGRAGRLGQPGELPLQRGHPQPRPLPLAEQHLPRRLHAFDPSHPPPPPRP